MLELVLARKLCVPEPVDSWMCEPRGNKGRKKMNAMFGLFLFLFQMLSETK